MDRGPWTSIWPMRGGARVDVVVDRGPWTSIWPMVPMGAFLTAGLLAMLVAAPELLGPWTSGSGPWTSWPTVPLGAFLTGGLVAMLVAAPERRAALELLAAALELIAAVLELLAAALELLAGQPSVASDSASSCSGLPGTSMTITRCSGRFLDCGGA